MSSGLPTLKAITPGCGSTPSDTTVPSVVAPHSW